MKRLRGENLVKELHTIESDNHIYIAMEAADKTLWDILNELNEKHKYLPPEKVKKYLYGILNGLIELNHSGIVHRDIKPNNILMKG